MNLPQFGLAVREENRLVLDDPRITAAEITFERANDPLRVSPYLDRRSLDYVSVHSLKLSVASPDRPRADYLDALSEIVQENDAQAVSDHLGFTRNGNDGAEIGHFALPPLTPAALDATCRNVDHVQRRFDGIPFFLENIAYLFRFEGTTSEAEFLKSILSRTGCGWLLDVTNVYANAVNFGFDASEFLEEVIPAATRLQIHLSGGFWSDRQQRYVDSHSDPIPEPVWSLYESAMEWGRGRIEAVFIERDQNFPGTEGWIHEIERARALATPAKVRT